MDVQYEQSYPTPFAASPLLPLLLMSLTAQKHSPNTKSSFEKEYDYIIVGAGSAGSVLAGRLSEEDCVTVLLLEAGKTPPLLTEIPASSRSFVSTDIDWQYLTTPQKYTAAGHNDRRIPWPSGKAVGGSGILNDHIYTRGNRQNFDGWPKGWSYKKVLPYFKKLENNTNINSFRIQDRPYHSDKGPITVSRPTYNSTKKQVTGEAIHAEGFKLVDPNAKEQIGFYDYQAYIRDGQVCSAAKGYLVPSENRENLTILKNAMVKKVIFKNNTNEAIGVQFDFRNETHTVNARREVILSAGTTNTAQLLMLSGIGPMSELNKFNIKPVIADLPVGLNLQEDPAVFLIYQVDNEFPIFEEEIKQDQSILQYNNSKTGPLTAPEGIHYAGFLNNYNQKNSTPDYMLYLADLPSYISLLLGFTPEVLQTVFLPLANQSLLFCAAQLVHPWSRGTVSLNSTDVYDKPVINPNYFADTRDVEDMVHGLKTCERIMNNRIMKEKLKIKPLQALIPGCEEFEKNEDLYFRCIVRTMMFTTNHQVGTARMGYREDPRAVVDPELKVKGVRKLRVVDASVMPDIIWGNPNAATMMIAEKAADIIKRDIKCNKTKKDGKTGWKAVFDQAKQKITDYLT